MACSMAASKDENLDATKALHLAVAMGPKMDQTCESNLVVRKDAKTVPYWDALMEYPIAPSKDENLDATKALHLAVAMGPKMDQTCESNLVVRKDAKTVPYWDTLMEYPIAPSKDENLDATKALHLATAREPKMDQT